MNKSKIQFFGTACAVVLILSIPAVFGARELRLHLEASKKINTEIKTLEKETERYERNIEKSKNEIDEINETISKSGDVRIEFEKYQSDVQDLESNIEKSRERIEALQNELGALNKEREKYESISNSELGEERTFEKGDYSCPKDISPGRYKIIGSGNLLLYNSSNTLKISENLSKLDTSSYVMPIEEGDVIKLSENVIIVEVN